MQTRVAIVDDHALLAESLGLALSAEGLDATTVTPIDGLSDATALVTRVLEQRPHVVLLDLDLGGAGDGVLLIERLRRAGCDVVVVTASEEPVRWGECLARGAEAVLPKQACLDEIVETISRVTSGEKVLPLHRRQELIERWQRRQCADRSTQARLGRLSPREAQVLYALTTGQRVRDIARQSFVAEATVRTQVKSILFKLGVTSQIAAVAMVRETGWTGDVADRDQERGSSTA